MRTPRMAPIAVLIILSLLLTACAATPTPEPAAPAAQAPAAQEATAAEEPTEEAAAQEAAAEVTELVLMGWSSSPAENERLQTMVDTFNGNNADLNVTLSQVPDYDTKLQVSLAGGSPPDVFYVDSFRFHDLQAAGALDPMGAENLENPDDFYPNLRAAFTADDVFYCPPKDFSTLGLIYNTDMFDAAGLDYPTADWTWDDLRAAAEALTDPDAGVYGLSLSADLARLLAFIYQAGGSITSDDFAEMTVNSAEAKAALDFYVGLVRDGYAAQPADLDSGWNGEAFGKGRAAMTVEGNWMMSFMRDQFPDVNFGVAELPAGPGGKATMSFTVCYAAPAGSPKLDASYRLINALTGPEGMAAWSGLGLAMPTRESLRDDWLAQYPEQEAFLNGAEYAYPWQFTPGFQEVLDAFNDGIQQAFAGSMTTDMVLQTVEQVGTEVLNR